MLAFIGLTIALFAGLSFFSAYMKREEVMANWSKYKGDPLYMFAAPMFKPDDDPRSRTKFAMDNFFDVIQGMVTNVFSIFLQPVFKIFQLFNDAVVQSLSGLFNIRMLLGNMWKKWNSASDVFMRRFYSVFHQLRVTFIKLFSSMEKSFGVAVSSIYMGLSTINTVLSFIDLMFKVILIILAILVIMVIFLFFVLWPVIPLIVAAVSVLVVAGVGAAAGMSDSFCFAEDTPVMTSAGPVPIQSIVMEQELEGGATVKGILAFDTNTDDLYELWGIKVSGTHIVYMDKPVHVRDHPDARKLPPIHTRLYCLITSDRKIPIHTSAGIVLFADWEELDDEASLQKWHKEVFEMLNPDTPYVPPTEEAIDSEAVVSPRTRIVTPIGPAEIRGIRPGSLVLDAQGRQTRVTGVVRVAKSEIKQATRLSETAYVAAGAWLKTSSTWSQPVDLEEHEEEQWYSLFTESGSFQLCEQMIVSMRDFTDVGANKIGDTYDWVLDAVKSYKNEPSP